MNCTAWNSVRAKAERSSPRATPSTGDREHGHEPENGKHHEPHAIEGPRKSRWQVLVFEEEVDGSQQQSRNHHDQRHGAVVVAKLIQDLPVVASSILRNACRCKSFPQLGPQNRVKAGRRFIQNQESRVRDERAGERNPAELPA